MELNCQFGFSEKGGVERVRINVFSVVHGSHSSWNFLDILNGLRGPEKVNAAAEIK